MRILIAGCGDVGTVLGRALAERGHRVFGLRRNPAGLPEAIEGVAADLSDPTTLGVVPEGLDAVVHLAAADGRTEDAYERAYVAGPRHLLAQSRDRGEAPRWLYASSTAVYAQSDGSWVDETSPTEPSHFSGRKLLEGEGLVRAAGLQATVVRLAGIYGPGRTRLIDRVRSRAARVTAAPGERAAGSAGTVVPRFTNRIHREDAAAIFAHLLDRPADVDVLIGVDDDPAPEAEVLAWLAARLGVEPPREGRADPQSRRGLSNKRCSNRRLREHGLVLRFPSYREGYADLLEHEGDRA